MLKESVFDSRSKITGLDHLLLAHKIYIYLTIVYHQKNEASSIKLFSCSVVRFFCSFRYASWQNFQVKRKKNVPSFIHPHSGTGPTIDEILREHRTDYEKASIAILTLNGALTTNHLQWITQLDGANAIVLNFIGLNFVFCELTPTRNPMFIHALYSDLRQMHKRGMREKWSIIWIMLYFLSFFQSIYDKRKTLAYLIPWIS